MKLPTRAEVEQLRKLVDYRRVELDQLGRRVRIGKGKVSEQYPDPRNEIKSVKALTAQAPAGKAPAKAPARLPPPCTLMSAPWKPTAGASRKSWG